MTTAEELKRQAEEAEREALALAQRAVELRKAASRAVRAETAAAGAALSHAPEEVLDAVRFRIRALGFGYIGAEWLARSLGLPISEARHALVQLTALGEAEFIPADEQHVDRWRAPRPICNVCGRPVGNVLEPGHCPFKAHRAGMDAALPAAAPPTPPAPARRPRQRAKREERA